MNINQSFFTITPKIISALVAGYVILFSTIFIGIWLYGDVEFSNLLVHSTIETSGAVASIAIAILIMILLKQKQLPVVYVWMALGFISMGIFDILHASVLPSSLFVWLHSLTVLTGGFIFAGIWLPRVVTEFFQKISVFLFSSFLLLAFALFSIVFQDVLPAMLVNGQFTAVARSFNIIGGILFLSTFIHFIDRIRTKRLLDDFIFMNLCLLFGLAGFLFELSQVWLVDWWAWHILRLVAHLLIFFYLFLNYYRTQQKLVFKIDEHYKSEQALKEKTYDLGERIKELNCLYQITELIENEHISQEDLFKGVIELVKSSWQYPDITGARIVYHNSEITSDNFKDTQWKQSAPININYNREGVLEVCYLAEKPTMDEGPFLKEERFLINSIVSLLGRAIERKQTDDELKKSEKKYRLLFDSITYGYAIHEIITDEKTGKPIDYRFIDINKSFNDHTAIEQVTGLKTSEIIGKTVLDVLPDTEDYWIQKYGNVALTGTPIDFEAPAEAFGKYYHVMAFQNQPGQFAVMFSDITERKIAEEELRKLSQAIEQSGSAIIITDLKGKIEFANPEFYKNTGYSPEEIIGGNPNLLKSGFHSPEFYREMWQTISSGEVWRGELVNKKKNGDLYWEAATISPVVNPAGEVTHYVAVKDDITKSKKIEEELTASEKRYRLLFETMKHGVVVHDASGRIIDANPAAERMLGLSLEQMQGKTSIDSSWKTIQEDGTDFPGENHPAMIVLKTGEVVTNKVMGVLNPKENAYKWLSINAIPQFKEGTQELISIHVTFSDLTSRKEIERKLLESKNRYQEFVEGTSDLITRVTHEGIFEFVNHMSNQIFGLSSEDCIGKYAFDFVHPDDQETTQNWFENVIKNKETFGTIENRQIHVNGQSIHMLWMINFIYDETGHLIGANSIGRNISERKLFENELKAAQEHAIEANQAKSTFLANMSHELRTPLNAILGFTQILEKQLANRLTSKQSRFFNTLKNSGNHLLDMVNDILDLSKVEAGKIELDLKPFDLGKMITRSRIIVKETAFAQEVLIEENIQPNLGWINGDETRLKQIMYNLLSNAVKFTQAGKRVGIDAASEGDRFIITVWDEGEGIPDEYLNSIFNPFEQVKGSKIAKEKGTGLGLAISRRLIEMHHGTITVSSQPGKGSRFTITLPGRIPVEDQNSEQATPELRENKPVKARNVSILAVEDNVANRELIKVALAEFKVEFAVNGEEGVLKASEKTYDLILMDIQLPIIDGTEAMLQIRKNSTKHIPIIALTASAMKGDEEKYLKAGFDDYQSKPIDIEILIQKLENCLEA